MGIWESIIIGLAIWCAGICIEHGLCKVARAILEALQIKKEVNVVFEENTPSIENE